MKKNHYKKRVNDLQAKDESNSRDGNTRLEHELARSRSILRSKARWLEQEKCNTKYFYGLEKRKHQIKTRSKLKMGEKSYTEDQFEILEIEKVLLRVPLSIL